VTTKEMVPAVKRVDKSTIYLCRPEWELLCRIRYGIQQVIKETRARDMRKLLIGLIAHMDDMFDNWPEDPK